jgi:moderate conductance mechanosensitive channel
METEKVVRHSLIASADFAGVLADVSERFVTWLFTSGVRILVIVLLASLAIRVLRSSTVRLHKAMVGPATSAERVKRADTILGMVRAVCGIFVALAAAMMILRETGIDIGPVLATAGIGGLAIGFGAQTLVKDVISGFFLLVEDQVRLGDIVEVAGKSGVVERISLRTIQLRDVSGNLHVVPNGNVTVVTNMTRDYSRYVVEAQVARREDPDRVFDALVAIAAEMQKDDGYAEDILQPLEVLGVETLSSTTMTIKARVTTRAMRQWRVGREFNRRMKKRFDELGITAA